MSTHIHTITARRISGDLYQCNAPNDTLNEQYTWTGVCRLAAKSTTREVIVHNVHRGEDELARIEYRPTKETPLSSMPSPSMATEAVITQRASESQVHRGATWRNLSGTERTGR